MRVEENVTGVSPLNRGGVGRGCEELGALWWVLVLLSLVVRPEMGGEAGPLFGLLVLETGAPSPRVV